jgi:hypothetical protein
MLIVQQISSFISLRSLNCERSTNPKTAAERVAENRDTPSEQLYAAKNTYGKHA